jgi:hypothetical protein
MRPIVQIALPTPLPVCWLIKETKKIISFHARLSLILNGFTFPMYNAAEFTGEVSECKLKTILERGKRQTRRLLSSDGWHK